MSHVHLTMMRASSRLTKAVGLCWGGNFPFYYVTEYPKSGGTWLSRMVADALQVPFPQRSVFPLGCSCLVHNHWKYHPRLNKVIYMYRDGRDVATSFYFHVMRNAESGARASDRKLRRRMERLFGTNFDPADSVKNLPLFLEDLFRNPYLSRLTWSAHVESWYRPGGGQRIAYVSYEELLEDCESALQRVVEQTVDREIEEWRIKYAVAKYSMRRATGRAPGVEDRSSFIRKGVAGDWTNHFSREAGEVFDDLAGDTLVALGYESDRQWLQRHRFVDDPAPIIHIVTGTQSAARPAHVPAAMPIRTAS